MVHGHEPPARLAVSNAVLEQYTIYARWHESPESGLLLGTEGMLHLAAHGQFAEMPKWVQRCDCTPTFQHVQPREECWRTENKH